MAACWPIRKFDKLKKKVQPKAVHGGIQDSLG